MKTRYVRGDKVIHLEEERTIVVTQKNFSTGKIRYQLDNGVMAEEIELKGIGQETPKVDTEIEAVRAEYLRVLGKEVSSGYKNKKDWMLKKIQEAQPENFSQYDVLAALSLDELVMFALDKKVDLAVEDYDDKALLLEDLCGELGIEVPN